MTKLLLLTAVSASALCASAAFAQDVAPPAAGRNPSQAASPTSQAAAPNAQRAVDEVVVTGSRTVTDGYSSPTPVTVVSSDQLALSQPQSLSQGLNTLPQFKNSASPQSVGSGTSAGNPLGASYLNLRGLGTQRTLTLLDGHRTTPTTFLGPSDIGLLPEGLISRVDVVTGGASAAYGSDAISGVVNFALNKTFDGLKGEVQGGQSERGDAQNYKATLTGGQEVLDGKGHVEFNAEYYHNRGIFDYAHRDWALNGYAIVAVPGVTDANKSPTNPKTVVAPGVVSSAGTYGGLITNTVLKGTQFLPGGQTAPFVFGSLVSSTTMVGGSGVDTFQNVGLQPDQKRANFFGRFDYDLTSNLHAYAQVMYGEDRVFFIAGPSPEIGSTAFTIFSDNAYLPASIRAAMATNHIASFQLGRLSQDIAENNYDNDNKTGQLNLGLTGEFGKGWKYELYYSHGENRDRAVAGNEAILPNLYRAADAVLNPTTGQIVCRSTLTNPTDGCVPLNVFGAGSPSAAAKAYAVGQAVSVQTADQDYLGFSVAGDAFRLPAGPVSVAAGGEYRRDTAKQTADALSTATLSAAGINGVPASLVGRVGLLDRQNFPVFSGRSHLTEGFLEVLAPILKDQPFAKSLDLNGAVRYTDYSLSGGVTTWKVGLSYQPLDDLRLRGTRSRDIRAPSLFEQFLTPSNGPGGGPITDPFTNTTVAGITVVIAGNRNLVPEQADTTSYGFVYRPSAIPGFGISVDYWKVDIANAISQLFQSSPATNAQLLINQCFAGNTALCGAIHRVNGVITTVDNTYFNISNFTASGVDIETSYVVPVDTMFGWSKSSLSLRGVASYVGKLASQLPGGLTIDRAGDDGQSAAGSPHWTGTFDAIYTRGPLSLFLQERYIEGGKLDNTLTASDININHVPDVFYTDATIRYKLQIREHPSELFLTVNNLFDKDPPVDPRFLTSGTLPTNRSLYDVVGRQYTGGIKFQF